MQTIKKKLRSQYGASITFALLLFLVCAALCSVIIVAATSSAGRMSKLAETDQRYYAVTSAADLITELLKEPVTIVQREEIKKVEKTTHTEVETSVTKTISETVETDEGTQTVDKLVTEITTTFSDYGPVKDPTQIETRQYLINKAAKDIQETDYSETNQVPENNDRIKASLANDAAYWVFENKSDKVERMISLAPSDESPSPLNGTLLPVEIKESLNPQERLLVFTIYNSDNSKGTPYTLELSFQALQTESIIPGTAVKETEIQYQTPVTTYPAADTVVKTTTTITTVTSTVVNTTIKAFTWELKSVRTISA